MGKLIGYAAAALCVFLAAFSPALAAQGSFDAGRAAFSIKIGGFKVEYAAFFTSVLPGEELTIALDEHAPAGPYVLSAPDGETAFVEGAARWRAPDAPGESRELTVKGPDGDTISLQAFILQPKSAMQDGKLNGYQIGPYPDEPLRGLETYLPPQGFIEVTEANRDMKVSPHFTLGQFLCKQQMDHPQKYLLLDMALIAKLEALLEDVNEAGVRADTFFVMSGYRTPWYNKAIGNTTTYSQHVFGGAADIYVDVSPRDGDMDDINGDGKVTIADAEWLLDRAAALELREDQKHLVGGLGKYDRNSAHGPFLHVDARGYQARW